MPAHEVAHGTINTLKGDTPVVSDPEILARSRRACKVGSASCRFENIVLAPQAAGNLEVVAFCAADACDMTSEKLQAGLDRLRTQVVGE